jgi:hypothetical protein
LRVQKEPWRTVRQSRNISSETPLVGSSRSVGIMPRKRYVSGLCSELLRRLFAGDDGWNNRCLLRSEVVVVNRHRASPRA